jgi:hypothetical protein
MKTYAERVCFQPSHLRLLSRVEAYVALVSDSWGNELRCHELARAVQLAVNGSEHKLVVIDGHCGPIEHSWLCCSDGVIVDAYTPGRLPAVQILDPFVGERVYRPGPTRQDIRQEIVDRLVAEMRGP